MPEPCRDCEEAARLPFNFGLAWAQPPSPSPQTQNITTNPLLTQAFHSDCTSLSSSDDQPKLIPLCKAPAESDGLVALSTRIYGRSGPNCLAVGLANGTRGAVFGAAFGAVSGASSAAYSGATGPAALTFGAQHALRSAAGFAAWTAVFGTTKCALVRTRRRDDWINSGMAGAFTGAVLTLAQVRGQWRYNRHLIMTNTACSALIAIVFRVIS